MSRTLATTALFLLAACKTGSSNTLQGAAVMTGVALGAAAVERSQGGCIAICTNGTTCNGKTGLCEVLPCRGRCEADQHCEVSFTDSKCVAGGTGVTAVARGAETKTPAIVPVQLPNSSSAAPTIVPTAEQQPPK